MVEGSVSAEDRSFETASFIKDTYGGTLSQALKAVIPAKAKAKPVEIKTLVRKMDKEQLLALAADANRTGDAGGKTVSDTALLIRKRR